MIPATANHQLSSEVSTPPTFLLVGAAKAGTTSVHEYLRQHAEVFVPEDPARKEPTYFLNRGRIVDTFKGYLALFEHAEGFKAVGEASTSYLYAPESPELIKNALGDVKIVIVLRNPAIRAYSLWAHIARRGFEGAPTFEVALAREDARMKDPAFHEWCYQFPVLLPENFYYFHSGLYHDQVSRYVEMFGRDNVHVMLFEKLKQDPLGCCRQLFEFLEVDSSFEPKIEVHNRGWVPRSVSLQRRSNALLYMTAPDRIRGFVPKSFRAQMRSLRTSAVQRISKLNRRTGPSPTIAPATYCQLIERYRDEILRLEGLLNRDLGLWLES